MPVTTKEILYMLIDQFELRRDSLAERVKLQKTIYLLQATGGMKLGYGFGWYRYGPYSQDLVYDAYDVLQEEENYSQRIEGYEFNAATKTNIDNFREKFGAILGDSKMLELMASIRFIKNTWYPDLDKSNAFGYLTGHKVLFYDGKLIEPEKVQEAFDFLH